MAGSPNPDTTTLSKTSEEEELLFVLLELLELYELSNCELDDVLIMTHLFQI